MDAVKVQQVDAEIIKFADGSKYLTYKIKRGMSATIPLSVKAS